jgi:chemotaxis protein methyltransferase CheR
VENFEYLPSVREFMPECMKKYLPLSVASCCPGIHPEVCSNRKELLPRAKEDVRDLQMDFDRFLRHICPLLDLEWRKYRRRAARHRIDRRMRELRLHDYASYLELLETDPLEADGLADLMRVTVSRFFRDRTCWSDLIEKAIPVILAENTADATFRVWSAGCCGGEEPYTMAVVWLEYLQPLFPGFTIDILATDIDDTSLARAYKGLFASSSLRETSPEIRDRWFILKKGMWMVDGRVKELVRFRKHNMMKDPLPAGIDLVFCRNLVFTYYRGDRLLTAARRLHAALRPGGSLMTGNAEIIDDPVTFLFEK